MKEIRDEGISPKMEIERGKERERAWQEEMGKPIGGENQVMRSKDKSR
jgi:hypothetical protein